ncbi:MAG: hypothetical protein ACI8X5_001416 [Planctomycetota bacterium]
MKAWWNHGGVLLAGVLLLAGWFAFAWSDTPIDPETGSYAISDSESAWRLHRISLVLGTSRLAQVDTFDCFPEVRAVMDLPVYDELAGLAARLFVGKRAGGPNVPIDEQALQTFAAAIGPVLLLIFFAAVYSFLRSSLGSSRFAAFLALGYLAMMPVVIEAGRPGSLRIELFLALLFALQMKAVFAIWSAKQDLDRLMFAMLAGGVGSVGMATSALFVVPTIGIWTWFVFYGLSRSVDERAMLMRCALLFWITSAVGGILPAIGGPWVPATSGPIAGWTDLWGSCVLVGVVPLVVLQRGSRRISEHTLVWFAGGFAAIVVLAGAFMLYRMGPHHEKSALLMAALRGEFAFVFMTSVPLLLSVLMYRIEPDRRSLLLMGIAGVGMLGFCAAHLSSTEREEESLAAAQAVSAARWLCSNTEISGPWNSVHGGQSYGVLSAGWIAPLIANYARRPGTRAGFSCLGEELVFSGTPREAVEAARDGGFRYMLIGPGDESSARFPWLEELRSGERESLSGVRRVWQSERPLDSKSFVILALDAD